MNLQDILIMRGERENFRNWNAWAEEARIQFEPTTTAERARLELQDLKQIRSVREYVQKFNQIRFRIPDLGPNEAYISFTRGLKEKPREAVLAHVRQDVEQAINMAERIDDIVGLTRSKPEERTAAPRPTRSTYRKSFRTSFRPKPEKEERVMTVSKYTGKEKKPVKCWSCGKLGHMAHECRSRVKRVSRK